MDEILEKEYDGELRVGMEVHSDAEAYDLYNNYALKKGFSVRKHVIRRDSSNNIRQRKYVCSKQRFQMDEDLCEVNKVNKLETRTGCKALIRFTVTSGVWAISHINLNHNHELAKAEERQFLKSDQKIPKTHGNVISSMVDAGVRPTQAYSYLANEVGGAENIKFTKKDARNYL
ncbi:hypothetical protein Ddye_008159 [Dipteronia dyeriana]|uniref:FAR1 domain-containing protein n=1 Tax=Dipteronia dyeriana TaxID=168575 RepID=A0AAE0CL21_9ROSI|nr:hypothetical protein Ddye_008159 [Dipteronia dyeriana]